MSKFKEVIITAIITSLLGGIGYVINDYVNLKKEEVIRKENEILNKAYRELDSLHKVEISERERYKKYITKLVDSLLSVTNANSELTKEAIILLEDNEHTITEFERDSVYSVLKAYTIGAKSSINK